MIGTGDISAVLCLDIAGGLLRRLEC